MQRGAPFARMTRSMCTCARVCCDETPSSCIRTAMSTFDPVKAASAVCQAERVDCRWPGRSHDGSNHGDAD